MRSTAFRLVPVLWLAALAPCGAASYTYTTLAGATSVVGSADGTGAAARFSSPNALASDSAGNLYVADTGNYTIRKVSPGGVVTTLAGFPGATGTTDGFRTAARFGAIYGLAATAAGEVFVSDYDNHTIRRIAADGTVTTFAGTAGTPGTDDGAAATARFRNPTGIVVDREGNLFVADRSNRVIRRISRAGIVSTFAGSPGIIGSIDGTGSAARFSALAGLAIDGNDTLYATENSTNVIRKITSDGVVTTLAGTSGVSGSTDGTGRAARFAFPSGISVDGAGQVFVADTSNQMIRKITAEGVVSIFAGRVGLIGSADGTGRSAYFSMPYGLAVDPEGNVLVAEAGNHSIRRISTSGVTSVLAGSGGSFGSADGPGPQARFHLPSTAAVAASGVIYLADSVNATVRRISPLGAVTTLAGRAGEIGSIDGAGDTVRFGFPSGVAVDAAGQIYVADAVFGAVRKLTPEGVSSTLAGQNSVLVNGSADGQGSAARFNRPLGAAVDRQGNVYVADYNNHTIRKISSEGAVTTVAGQPGVSGAINGTGNAARFNYPYAVAVDAGGTLYVADTSNHLIRRITPEGAVTTLAGSAGISGSASGPGSSARFYFPLGVAVDAAGFVYVADTTNNLIRRIDSSGNVSTIGGRLPVFTAESADGTGTAARFNNPFGIATDSSGALYIVDAFNNRLVKGVLDVEPVVTRQPQSLPVTPGSRAVLSVVATGGGLAYQWNLNGQAISGATTATYNVPRAQASDAGTYTVTVTNSAGTATSNAATLSVISTTDVGRISNLAIRSTAGTGGQTLIVGFALGGAGTQGTKPILMRGVGPALGNFGLTGFLPDPKLEIFSSATGARLHENDNWNGDAQVVAVSARVGAFALTSSASRDAALFLPEFSTGSYTAQVSSAGTTTGVALAEIYDASLAGTFTATTPRLVNVSARTQVGTGGDVLIAGFYLGGLTAKTVLIRAIGPTLTAFGVPGALADPALELFSGATRINENDNWGGTAELSAAFSSVGAFPLSPASRDAALLVTLAPGSYTAQVTGAAGATGIALVEVYEVP